ncbi:Cytoplasmic protein OS=Streptomyces chartreusis OX=1969 GN=CP983_00565 PE=4 SV=1 [Streptomyces chartreusis]
MQTFLPHPDFRQTALLLDRRRLGKQRVEALQGSCVD